jgi:hypothetical protein
MNEMAEVQAGLRKPPSRAEELAEDKIILERGIAFMMQQPPSTRQSMRDNLEFHHKE